MNSIVLPKTLYAQTSCPKGKRLLCLKESTIKAFKQCTAKVKRLNKECELRLKAKEEKLSLERKKHKQKVKEYEKHISKLLNNTEDMLKKAQKRAFRDGLIVGGVVTAVTSAIIITVVLIVKR